jgi:hypothetical protein
MCERAYHVIAAAAQTAERVSYEGWITIMLAGITILVTLLGIGLAVMAIFGYSGVKEAARDAADKAAREAAERVIRRDKDKWLKDMGLGLELPVAQSEPTRRASNQVAENYPNEPGREAEHVNGSNEPNGGADHPAAPEGGPS